MVTENHDDKEKKLSPNWKWATGVAVTIFYFCSLLLVFGGFAGYISRVNLGNDLPADIGTVDSLIFLTSLENDQRNNLYNLRSQLRKAQDKHAESINDLTEIKTIVLIEQAQTLETFIPLALLINANAEIFTKEFLLSFNDIYLYTNYTPVEKSLLLRSVISTMSFIARPDNDDETISTIVGEVMVQLASLSGKLESVAKAEAGQKIAELRLQTTMLNIRSIEAEIESLNEDTSAPEVGITNNHRALIDTFKTTLWQIPFKVIQMPTIVLTLVVTIAAGALGSTVSFTRNFLRGDASASASRLLLNVSEGIAASIAIFLFAGAGMLMLSQGGGGSNGNTDIGPYMVAFLAFVSGFMAQDAFDRIEEAGRKLFGTQSTTEGQTQTTNVSA